MDSTTTTATANGANSIITQPDVVSLATVTIWAYLIPHMFVEFAEYRLALSQSSIWSRPELMEDVRRAVKVTFITNITLGVILYFAISTIVSLLTENMDRRMVDIVMGSSRLFAGFVFFVLSVNMPQWYGVYFMEKRHVATFRSLREVKFNFAWSLWKQISAMFFFNMFFSCRTLQLANVYGVIVGAAIGALLIYLVYLARYNCKSRKRAFAITTIVVLVFTSYFCIVIGAIYIADVWLYDSGNTNSTAWEYDDDKVDDDFVTLDTGDAVVASLMILVIIIWPIVGIIYHIFCCCYAQKKKKKNDPTHFTSQIFTQSLNPAAFLTILKHSRHRSKKDVSSDPSGNANVLTIRSTPSQVLESSEREGEEVNNNDTEDQSQMIEITNDSSVMSSSEPPVISDGGEKEVSNPTSVVSAEGNSSVLFIQPQHEDNIDSMAEEYVPSRFLEDEVHLDAHDEDGDDVGDDEVNGWDDLNFEILNDADAPSYSLLFRAKLYETYPNLFCCFKKALLRHVPERRMSLYGALEKKISCHRRFWNASMRILWYVLSFLFLFLTIVNIGSTTQQDNVRAALGPAWTQLYPPDYNNGTMCAWNEASPNGTIKNFTTLQSVYDANWTVIHCGACGACSNWNDLSLQWTTRHELAKLSKKCAQKSMFGSWDDVTACNEDKIGFLPECAECWTYDEINTKSRCFWIFLQSIFIDAVSDFSVGFNDITSATCDEALSGPVFVPCSGATRRRMGIISDIPRPAYQQCRVAEHNWSVVFNHP